MENEIPRKASAYFARKSSFLNDAPAAGELAAEGIPSRWPAGA